MRVREGAFLLQIQSLTITHRKDQRTIIQNFDFVLNRGDKAVLIGEEGNGKSTLLKWIYNPDLVESYAEADGIRTLQGELLGYLPQELPDEEKAKTVYDYLSPLSGPEIRAVLKQFPGTIISISHDRKYISEVCDTVYRLTSKGLEQDEKGR